MEKASPNTIDNEKDNFQNHRNVVRLTHVEPHTHTEKDSGRCKDEYRQVYQMKEREKKIVRWKRQDQRWTQVGTSNEKKKREKDRIGRRYVQRRTQVGTSKEELNRNQNNGKEI